MRDVPPQIFRQLLDDAALNARDADARVAMAMDVDYWRRLTSSAGDLPPSKADARSIDQALSDFSRDGVYRIDRAVHPATLAVLNGIVDRVLAGGWPAVFAFACDGLWQC